MKKTYKNLALELLEKDTLSSGDGLTTLQISERLDVQRTNVSRILNQLVDEGLALKNETKRPVVYKRSNLNFEQGGTNAFEELIGWNASLKQAVHLAKAAVMYPNRSLYTLLVAPPGSGKSTFARKMYDYTLEVNILPYDAPFVKLNCLHYLNDMQRMNAKFKDVLEKAENGFLYIDHCNLLDSESKSQLSFLLEDGFLEGDERRRNHQTVVVCSLSEPIGMDEFSDSIQRKFSIIIKLPPLEERGLGERFQFIKKFLCSEADKSNCSIRINSEVLIALLLYNCKNNIKQLLNDIRQACASAYVRELNSENKEITLLIMDFPHNVRSGLLSYKNRRVEVDAIIKDGSNYIFKNNALSVFNTTGSSNSASIYDWIDSKSEELHARGFSKTEINTIVNVGIETELNKYRNSLSANLINKEQLSQLVDGEILRLVDEFLLRAEQRLNRHYAASIYYGLCLHLQSLKETQTSHRTMKIERIMEFIEDHKEEYTLATEFSEEFKAACNLVLSIDELILIAMFLFERDFSGTIENHPSILIAMHGDQTALSLAETVKRLSDISVYHYDLPLNKKPLDAYDDLKRTILNIPHEKGILVLYDMGSFKDIFNMLAMETGVHIKFIELPFTAMLLDCCRKVMLSEELEEAYATLQERYRKVHVMQNSDGKSHHPKVIVSICLTGDGGAMQIKHYLEKNFALESVEVVALQFKEQNELLLDLNRLSKEQDIVCIIGAFNPKIYGIPFVPIERVFHASARDFYSLFENGDVMRQEFLANSDVIFEHLSEELRNVDGAQLQNDLIDFIFSMEAEYHDGIEMNEKVGLLVHLACAISKLRDNNQSPINPHCADIVKRNAGLYQTIKKHLALLEEDFAVAFNDDEVANIICIIKKSRHG